MKDIEQIWNDIELGSGSQVGNIEFKKKESTFELNKFLRILKIEVILAATVVCILLILNAVIPRALLLFTLFISLISMGFSFYGIKLVKGINLASDSKQFVEDSIKVLKTFSSSLIILIIIVLTGTGILLQYRFDREHPNQIWILEGEGLLYMTISAVIILSVLAYIKFFYWKRIKRLRSLLKDMEAVY